MTKQKARAITLLTLFMIYILPVGIIMGPFNSAFNHIFATVVALIYVSGQRINIKVLFLWTIIGLGALYTGRFGYLDVIIIPVLFYFIENKEVVIETINESCVPYVCLVFTVVYSIIYKMLGIGGRGEKGIAGGVLCTAIGEVNLSGLSVFALGLVLRKKNKILGDIVLLSGVLTISRSYFLAVLCFVAFEQKALKNTIGRVLSRISYLQLTVFSSIVLFFVGWFFVYMFQNNKIMAYNENAGLARLLNFNDYSNYFRFLAIFLIVYIIKLHPIYILKGFSNEKYLQLGRMITDDLHVDFGVGIGTHNLFYSHLKMYGLFVFLEIMCVSKYLKRIVNENNIGIFIAFFLYTIILGSGLSGIWLYLATIVLVLYEKKEN